MHPRNAGNIDNLNRSAEYIKEFFVSSGARVTAQGVPDWLLRLCAWKPELPLPGNVLALSRSGGLYCLVGRIQDINAVRQVKTALLSSRDLSVYSMNAPWFSPGIDFSDHLNYWQHDIPAVMITDTAFYRNKQYHLPGDTADRLNYQKMAQVVDGVITLLYNSK